jgi:hypothetical protein
VAASAGRGGQVFFVVFLFLEVLWFFFDYLCKTFCIKLLDFQSFSVSFFCIIFFSKNLCASYDFAKFFFQSFSKKFCESDLPKTFLLPVTTRPGKYRTIA